MTDSPDFPESGQGRGAPAPSTASTPNTPPQDAAQANRAALDAEIARLMAGVKVVGGEEGARPRVSVPLDVGAVRDRMEAVLDADGGPARALAAAFEWAQPSAASQPADAASVGSGPGILAAKPRSREAALIQRLGDLERERKRLEELLEESEDAILASGVGELSGPWQNPFATSMDPDSSAKASTFRSSDPSRASRAALEYPDSVSATPGASDFNALEDRGSLPEPPGTPPWMGAGQVHRYDYHGVQYVIFDYANHRRLVTTQAQLEHDARCHERWAAEDAARKAKAGPPKYENPHNAPGPDDEKLARQLGVRGTHLCATCTHSVQFVAPVINPSGHDVFHQVRTLCSRVHDEDGESLQLNEVPVQYCSAHRPSLRKVAWRWAERNAETSSVAKRFLPVLRRVVRSY